MNKIKYKFLTIITFLFLFLIIPNIEAKSYISDFIDFDDKVELQTDEFIISLERKTLSNGTIDRPFILSGFAVNKIYDLYYCHYIVYFYNSSKTEIGATEGYTGIYTTSFSSPNSSNGSSISPFFDQSYMYDNYKLSDIKYYKILVERTTLEKSQKYLYEDAEKLILDGIDQITDSDINPMTIIKKNNIDESNNSTLSISLNNVDIPSENNLYKNYDYVIDKYDINIIVNENNSYDITETITAYFNKEKHGIIRTIPLVNYITRLDGTNTYNKAKITNMNVDKEFTTSRKNNNYIIKIGSTNQTLTGKQTYVVKYNYDIGKDLSTKYDELYFNIIGDKWDTVIGNITFTITMPKEFDTSKIGFSSGRIGSTDSSKVKYYVDGNTITGSYDGILDTKNALTIRCELEEGYFSNAKSPIGPLLYLMFIVPIVGLIISFFLWYKYGKDDKIIETIEFYPPEGLNSLEIGFLYKGKAKNEDVTSLLIYLANKGYIEIIDPKNYSNDDKANLHIKSKIDINEKINELQNKIDEEEKNDSPYDKIKYYKNILNIYKDINNPKKYSLKSIIRKLINGNDFLIRKLKDFDDNNYYEELFMKGLFKYDCTEVALSSLYGDFYKTNYEILNIINSKDKSKVFEKNNFSKKIIIILSILSILTTITIPTLTYAGIIELILTILIFTIFVISPILVAFIIEPDTILYGKIFCLAFSITCLIFGFDDWPLGIVMKSFNIYLLGEIIGLICVIGMIFLLKLMPKRTKYGIEMLGKIKGFKNFLETVEKEKLETMVLQDPTYFYNILPYTYVLGISNKWINKFKDIALPAPNWYYSSSTFNVISFGTAMNRTFSSAKSNMSSTPSSGSSGGSDFGGGGGSGGGSSGGGSGGGGGSSW